MWEKLMGPGRGRLKEENLSPQKSHIGKSGTDRGRHAKEQHKADGLEGRERWNSLTAQQGGKIKSDEWWEATHLSAPLSFTHL